MKKIILVIWSVLFICSYGFSQVNEDQEFSLDEEINAVTEPVANYISNIVFYSFEISPGVQLPIVLIWLFAGAIFFTFYLGFINVRGFKHAINIVKGKYTKPGDPGEVTQFQALTAALSGTVGLGNIAGVAIAISIGGPGATFWMILAGFLGMSSKFAECALGVRYRKVDAEGVTSGGPMYYLERGFKDKGLGYLGTFLAGFFALMCVGGSFGAGNMFQINQAASQFVLVTGGSQTFIGQNVWIFGMVMSLVVAVVIIGGIKTIAKVTERIVPFMCGIYALAALFIIISNIDQLGYALGAIVKGAFAPGAVGGGLVGVLIQGVRRAAFSNEAGIGSAAIAHSAVKTGIPVTEGFVGALEPFIDTVVVCTMTALVIVITGAYDVGIADGIELTSYAFATVIDWFPVILSIAVILFAFSTMISWSYYGLKAWTYLFGSGKIADFSYKLLFCFFVVIGASMNLGSVVDFSDAMIFAMSLPNLIGLYVLSPIVRADMKDFLRKIKSGQLPR
jgi:alanine or glycine:cation symporter, AGCS family